MARSFFIDAVTEVIARDRESWMAPHREAMELYDYRDRFQEWISDQSAAYSFIKSHAHSWERAVEEGTLNFSEKDERKILFMFRHWLENSTKALPGLS